MVANSAESLPNFLEEKLSLSKSFKYQNEIMHDQYYILLMRWRVKVLQTYLSISEKDVILKTCLMAVCFYFI